MLTFSKVGTNAGTEKRFQVLSTAPARDDSEISKNIREGDPQQIGGQLKALGLISKARRGGPDNPGRSQNADKGDQRQHQGQQASHISEKGARSLIALLGFIFGQNRHKRLGERPLSKNTAQQD